jgi:type IV pilus assembly protein PilE
MENTVSFAAKQRRTAGFSLIELMVVVMITAILAAIAVPTYQAQIRKARRVDAKTAVLDLAGREEKFLSLNNAYTNSPANLGYAAAGSASTVFGTVGGGYYQVYVCVFNVAAAAGSNACTTSAAGTVGTAYVVAAIPVTGLSQTKDTQCQYFAVDNTGVQFATSSTGGSGTDYTATCWK